ncbi:MAG: DUF2911 domain-containing protein [Cyclobacteriaceae bacterium]|nr:DUF2911 domain-containing protein [Cyclobacteriaceae bacterium]
MKIQRLFFFIALLIFGCSTPSTDKDTNLHKETHEHQHDESTEKEQVKKPKSPKTSAMGNIGNNHVHIEYSSPSVRGRQIWGGLVPFGEVWASGAHKATSINFSSDVKIDGVIIPKGKYGFFTIPNEKKWTVIINKNWEQHLADDYDQNEDLVRVIVKPEEISFVEALHYDVTSTDNNKGFISMKWEKLKISIEIINN